MDKNLKIGDVLVFKADNSWIGKTIAWLTDSDVSHAAMLYDENKIVEMGAKGIQLRKFSIEDTDNEKKVHVLRLNPEKNAAPLISAASKYVDAHIEYDFPALLLLAGLMIYKRIRPTSAMQKALDSILPFVCVQLDKIIAKMTKHKDKKMVCSQLVYQCYRDCGEDYAIKLRNGFLKAEAVYPKEKVDFLSADATVNVENYTVCLADLANLDEEQTTFKGDFYSDIQSYAKDTSPVLSEDTSEIEEQLAKEIYEAFTEPHDCNPIEQVIMYANNIKNGGTMDKVKAFIELAGKLAELLDMSMDGLFVSPADFLINAQNLIEVNM